MSYTQQAGRTIGWLQISMHKFSAMNEIQARGNILTDVPYVDHLHPFERIGLEHEWPPAGRRVFWIPLSLNVTFEIDVAQFHVNCVIL
jgi:hypothetical protein